MKTTHTPGPWRAAELDDPQYSHELSGPDVFMGFLAAWPVATDEMRANARLISGAPDLLAALETLVEHFGESHAPELESDHQGDGPHGCTYCESIAAARAAIASARGEPAEPTNAKGES